MKENIKTEFIQKLYGIQLGTLLASAHQIAIFSKAADESTARDMIGGLSVVTMVELVATLSVADVMNKITVAWEKQGKQGDFEEFSRNEWARIREEVMSIYEWKH